MIRQTPIHFVLVALFSLGLAFLIVDRIYRLRIEGKDDLLSIYREKLGLAPYNKTTYGSLRNAEIKQRAMDLAQRIRAFASKASTDSSTLSSKQISEMRTAKTDEEKSAVFYRQSNEIIASSNAGNKEYGDQFKTDSILLRDEILSRLPRDVASAQRQDREMPRYEWPTNPIGMNMVADHLEKIAKLLND